jgi:hypothetical protein
VSAVATLGFGLLLVVLASLTIKLKYRAALVLAAGTYLALGKVKRRQFYSLPGIGHPRTVHVRIILYL